MSKTIYYPDHTWSIQQLPMQEIKQKHLQENIGWIFTGPFRAIDNFAPIRVLYKDRLWLTSEHAYAAMKTNDRRMQDRIAGCPDPGQAKALGRCVKLRADWENVKFDFMWEILLAKFRQSETARNVLDTTGEHHIYEGNTWNDRVWGVTEEPGTDKWIGRNALGVQLMAIRSLMRKGILKPEQVPVK